MERCELWLPGKSKTGKVTANKAKLMSDLQDRLTRSA